MESETFHECVGMKSLTNPPPYFYVHDDAVDTATNTKFRAVMLAIAGQYNYIACQVDYCPWCGTQLTAYTLAHSRSLIDDQERDKLVGDEYLAYRKRHMRSGRLEPPFGKSGWEAVNEEYTQTLKLVIHAGTPEIAERLQHRITILRTRLAIEPPVEATPVTEDDFNQARAIDRHGTLEGGTP